jgi:hypothetical protein
VDILKKICETVLWKFCEKCFSKINKGIIFFLFLIATFLIPTYCYFKYSEYYFYKLRYFFSYNQKIVENNINILLSSCHIKGVYIGYIAVDNNIVYFDILQGILNDSTDFKPVNTLYLNTFYTLKRPLDYNSKQFIISDIKNNKISVIDYQIAKKNNMIYFIELFESLSVHGKVNSIVNKIFCTAHIVNKEIVFILGMSFADLMKISYCNDGSANYNMQTRILFDLKKSIVNLY